MVIGQLLDRGHILVEDGIQHVSVGCWLGVADCWPQNLTEFCFLHDWGRQQVWTQQLFRCGPPSWIMVKQPSNNLALEMRQCKRHGILKLVHADGNTWSVKSLKYEIIMSQHSERDLTLFIRKLWLSLSSFPIIGGMLSREWSVVSWIYSSLFISVLFSQTHLTPSMRVGFWLRGVQP